MLTRTWSAGTTSLHLVKHSTARRTQPQTQRFPFVGNFCSPIFLPQQTEKRLSWNHLQRIDVSSWRLGHFQSEQWKFSLVKHSITGSARFPRMQRKDYLIQLPKTPSSVRARVPVGAIVICQHQIRSDKWNLGTGGWKDSTYSSVILTKLPM